jgi:hypothetical protein
MEKGSCKCSKEEKLEEEEEEEEEWFAIHSTFHFPAAACNLPIGCFRPIISIVTIPFEYGAQIHKPTRRPPADVFSLGQLTAIK